MRMAMSRTRFCSRCRRTLPLTEEFFRYRSDHPHLFLSFCKKCYGPKRKGPRPSLVIDGHKQCKDCKMWLPANPDTFGLNTVDGRKYLRPYCKPCQTIRHAAYVKANPDIIKKIGITNYKKNRKRIIARGGIRQKALRDDPITGDIQRARCNEWRRLRRMDPKQLEKERERDREYAKTDVGSARYSRRAARKHSAEGHFTKSQVVAVARSQGFACFYCNSDISVKMTADHIIPLSRGGSNYITNIVAACGSCNSIKHNKTPEEFAKHIRLKVSRGYHPPILLDRIENMLRNLPKAGDQDKSGSQPVSDRSYQLEMPLSLSERIPASP